MSNFTYSEELYHHGIKGQKWGIRRYQKEDGTRTEAGKRRYAKLNDRVDRLYEQRTKDLRKIVNDPETYKNKYNRDRAQLAIDMETKLRDLRRAEIEDGYNFLENRMAIRSLGTWLIGGLPLSTINTGYDLIAHNDQWKARSEIKKQYKEDEKALKEQNINNHKKAQSPPKEENLYNGVSKKDKESYVALAKSEGRYNMDFLEVIQNSEIYYNRDKKAMVEEYSKYLDDPEDYWVNGSKKLKQV